jgi:spore coat protein CotH
MVVRTVFLTFDSPTWEEELAVFKDSDVKVPAMMSIDGRTLQDVGVSFRGQTSFRMTGTGQKRSMNIDLDFRDKDQNFLGATRLTLLNAAGDPSFLRSILYLRVARDYYPAFGANFMRLVINGENWGMYVNQQPADANFTRAVAGGSKGPIWKVPGTPNGRGGLEYWGEDPALYQRVFELSHKGGHGEAEAWVALIHLCRVLHETPPEKLPAALAPILDVDGVLRYLAVDNVLMNSDGYFARASDYNLYVDAQGRFHAVAHDVNEAMRPREVSRRRRGFDGGEAGANEMSLPPLAGADQPDKVLLNRLLAVPEFRQQYLGYIRDIN